MSIFKNKLLKELKPPLLFIPPKKFELTINFRSHSKIINLANSLIIILEQLYPISIDRLKKELSSSPGVVPQVTHSLD